MMLRLLSFSLQPLRIVMGMEEIIAAYCEYFEVANEGREGVIRVKGRKGVASAH